MVLVVPLVVALAIAARDRRARTARAQERLELLAHERARLQAAVRRLGDALAAKLDLAALTDVTLRGSIDALDAQAGRVALRGAIDPLTIEIDSGPFAAPLRLAAEQAGAHQEACQVAQDGVWALALPFGFSNDGGLVGGAFAVARRERPFREDEQALMASLVERARWAAGDIVTHQLLRRQATTDPLTKLGNRRKLAADLDERLLGASESRPLGLVLFDLDGFKQYNDTFGHPAGDAVLARLSSKLQAAAAPYGSAYRLGGDEFCVLLSAAPGEIDDVVAVVAAALEERGENFTIGASHGVVVLPREAERLDYAMQLADQRMYSLKHGRSPAARDQARDVLMHIIQAKRPALQVHSAEVAELCRRVGRRIGMSAEQLDELTRAAELHDIGKVGIPDAILAKPGALNDTEWELMQQHTVLGERILNAAPALRPVALIVRATHERWDGAGRPDGLSGEQIPLGARVIAACDAYHAMTSERPHHAARDHRQACAELRRESGGQFDPGVIAELLEELDDGAPSSSPAPGRSRRSPCRPPSGSPSC
ncbi:MAG: HD domain-containing phosphohydrolase [Solirubrobacteraceae bacterium]